MRLDQLIRVPDCTLCKLHQTADVVCQVGFGSRSASVMVVSKMANSRTYQEDLELQLAEVGLDLGDIFFTQALKCRTFDQNASNLDVKTCRTYLDQEIEHLKPTHILALGNEALLSLTGRSGITNYRGRVFKHGSGAEIIATISPASVNRNPGQRPGYMADLILFANRVLGRASGIKTPKYLTVDTPEKLRRLRTLLDDVQEIHFDVETHSDYFKTDGRIVSLSATCITRARTKKSRPGRFVFALPLYHPESVWRRKHRSVLLYLKDSLERIPRGVAHNGSYDVKWLKQYGIDPPFTFDTMLAIHLLNENVQKSLKPQAQARLGVEPWGIDTKDLLSKPLSEILQYNVLDTWYMQHIHDQLVEELSSQPRLMRVFKHVMMAGVNELIPSEMRGIWTDVPLLQERTPVVEQRLADVEAKILAAAGLGAGPEGVEGWPIQKVLKTRGPVYAQPNFNASNFARWMLFEHLGLPVLERGKEKPDGSPGDPSMAEGVMLQLKNHHPVVPLMLERVEHQKILSSFFGPYQELYDENHRIHTNFKMAGTVTGRLSSGKNDPDKISASRSKTRGVNLQQVPRDPFVRGVFGAPPGWSFVEADYSQIELRIVAYISRDRTMLRLYQTGADIHSTTAADVLGIPVSRVTKEDRKKAKAVNFGFVYGMGWRKFIQTAFEKYGAIFSEEEAQAVRTAFFEHFSGLPAWHARQRRLVNKYARVQSPLGRIRHLPDIHSPDPMVRAEAERQAINSPVQSFGSDLAVVSMTEIMRQFRSEGIQAHCVGLVHDAINFEIRDDFVAEALPIIKTTMEDMSIVERKFGVKVDVPIVADLKLGARWGDAKELSPEEVLNWRS